MYGIWQRLGRRGAALLFFGLLDVAYALNLFFPAPQARRSSSVTFLADVMPLWAWGLLWSIPAVLCLSLAWTRRDQAAFASAIAIKCVWGLTTLFGGLSGAIERAYVSVAIWLALAAFVAIISSWPEPPSIRAVSQPPTLLPDHH